MITFRNVKGEPFLALADLNWTHQVNGEKTLSGTIYSNEAVLYDIDRGWKVEFEGEIYYITYALPTDYRGSVTVQFDAIHEFFYLFGKSVVYQTINGSHTMSAYLDFIFQGSGYHYSLGVAVPAFEKENFGMQNRLSLFNNIINSTNVEFEVIGKEVRIVEKLGSDLSTIVRKGFNMQELGLEYNIGKFVTHVRGFGAFYDPENEHLGRLTAQYTSPLAEIYGILEADPVVDERFTQYQSLLDRLKQLVDSSYSISVNLSLEDLQREGYPYALPCPGDYILAINEDLNFKQKLRIVGVEKSLDVKGDVIEHQVVCSSLSAADEKNKADADNSQLWQEIGNGVRPIPNEWLTNAVNQATQSLLAAQTELRFKHNGILAVDKSNANRVVLMNSSGIGISTDGGRTFENALTALGLNASAIYTGILRAINIQGAAIRGGTIEGTAITGGSFETQVSGARRMHLTGTSLTFYSSTGAVSGILAGGTNTGTNQWQMHFSAANGSNIALGSQSVSGGDYTNRIVIHSGGNAHIAQSRTLFNQHNIETAQLLNCTVRAGNFTVNNNVNFQVWSHINMNGFSIIGQSDIRLKKNVRPSVVNGIAETKKIAMIDFEWKADYRPSQTQEVEEVKNDDTAEISANKNVLSRRNPTDTQFGIMAQSTGFLSELDPTGETHYLVIDQTKQIHLNTKTNQELIMIVENQERRIKALEDFVFKSQKEKSGVE